MSKKSFIDSIEVSAPCSEDWNEMRGNEQVRFCSHCNLNVNNLSAMTRKQALKIVRQSEGKICVRYVKHSETNAPVFADKLYKITRRAAVAAGVLGASLTLSTLAYAQGSPRLVKRSADSQTEISQVMESEESRTKTAAASISGKVTDAHGTALQNTNVTLVNLKTSEVRIVQTNEEGFYEHKDIEAGTYKLFADHALGYTEIANIEIGENSQSKHDLALASQQVIAELPVNNSHITVVLGGGLVLDYASALHSAVSSGNIEEVENLIAQGANLNEKDDNYSKITPLFLAVENGNVEMVETLLRFGAKVNARDANRQTPLMRLDEDASAELVRVLIKYGAKINLTDNEGNTALIIAARSAKAEVLQVLTDHHADVNAQNKEGRTALMEAAYDDNLENVRVLLLAGANVNLKDKEDETAWDLTTDDEIEKLLESHGATITEDN